MVARGISKKEGGNLNGSGIFIMEQSELAQVSQSLCFIEQRVPHSSGQGQQPRKLLG